MRKRTRCRQCNSKKKPLTFCVLLDAAWFCHPCLEVRLSQLVEQIIHKAQGATP